MEDIKRKSKVQEYAEAIVIAILIALFVRTFIVQAFKIPIRLDETDVTRGGSTCS